MAGDPGVNEEAVLVDQVQPVERGRELGTAQQHAGRRGVLEALYARAQVAADVLAVGPRIVGSRRGYDVLRLALQLQRPLTLRRGCLYLSAGDRRPVALHHLVSDAA